MAGRYQSERCESEGKTFDSKLERDVYHLLRSFLPFGDISVHHSIEFTGATQRYPAWCWKVDFYVPKWQWYIEAKGVRTPEWLVKLRAIDALKPSVLNNLTVVSKVGGEKICKGLFTVDFDTLNQFLKVRSSR